MGGGRGQEDGIEINGAQSSQMGWGHGVKWGGGAWCEWSDHCNIIRSKVYMCLLCVGGGFASWDGSE